MTARVDKKLNLVIPVDYGDLTYWVHSAPISQETFEQHYLIISKTFASIHGQGLGASSGPRVAFLLMKDLAMRDGTWEGATGIANTLVAEIVRRTNVRVPVEGKGWELLPFQEALDKQLLSPEDRSEVLNALTFFMVASSMYPRVSRNEMLELATSLWGAQLTPLNFSEFSGSLPTSTETASSTEKTTPAVSSRPT